MLNFLYCILQDKKGNYTKSELTSFPVKNIKIVQDVDKTEFGTWCFQVGANKSWFLKQEETGTCFLIGVHGQVEQLQLLVLLK